MCPMCQNLWWIGRLGVWYVVGADGDGGGDDGDEDGYLLAAVAVERSS